MNETYIPIGQAPFRAAHWISDETNNVANMIKMLVDHDLKFKFETVYEEYDISIEVYRGDQMVADVPEHHWLAILPDQTLKTYSNKEFVANFKENK